MESASPLPSGTVTFFFTDIQGSTQLWEQHPETMGGALARHDALVRQAIVAHGGMVFKTVGDQFCAVFTTAAVAVTAAMEAQRRLQAEAWGETGPLRVRMALHSGAAEERGGDYFGPTLNRVARLLEAGHGGQILLSLAAQELARDHLPEGSGLRDLGERRLKDLTRPERVFQLLHPDLPHDFPLLVTLDLRPNNLPAQATPLLGRDGEVTALRELLLGPQMRLVTLTGPGGTGKTRLALQVAASLIDDFQDGVFFVPLAPVSDPGLVLSTLAQTLGVKEVSGQSLLDSLKEFLRERQLLLLLDNFEQIVTASPCVAELLAAAPRLRVLVTSRAVLHLRGEQEFPVPPLSVPDPKRLPALSALSQYAAVELFIQRAVNVRPDFSITNENAPAVAEICARLDGLPLAIELAAARAKLLPPQTMLARLESRLKLLTAGARDLPARHQTLRGAIAWSYDLLDEAEKVLFRRLAVFVGGCTLEAAESVCNPTGDLEIDILDSMASLVDKSLLRQDEAGDEPRFRMLETIREYGQECLRAAPPLTGGPAEAEALGQQHAGFFLALAEAGAGTDQLEREHDNLRAALTWFQESGQAEAAIRLGKALWWFWYHRGYWTEGRERLARILAMASSAERSIARAILLRQAGQLAYAQGDLPAARALLEESLAILQEQRDTEHLPSVLNALGEVAQLQGDHEAARALFSQSLELLRRLGDRAGIAWAFQALGEVAYDQGEDSAEAIMRESLRLFQELEDQGGIALSLSCLGEIARTRGDLATAHSFHQQSLSLRRELGSKGGIARSLGDLGSVVAAQGDDEAARALYQECLSLRRELGSKPGIASCLEGLASLVGAAGQAERAARLFGAAQALRDAIGAPLAAPDRAAYESSVAVVRAALDGTAFQAAWAEGRSLPMDQAIALAMEAGQR